MTRERFARTAYLGAATVALGWASLRCGVTNEVIAHIAPEAGPPVEAGALCQSNPDCVSSELYCMKAGCDAGSGTCEFRDSGSCGNTFNLKCGCTGVQYFNDCVRQLHGEPATLDMSSCHPAQCDLTEAGACPTGTYCALGGGDCSGQMDPRRRQGFCWAVPEQCPAVVSFTTPGIPYNIYTSVPQAFSCSSKKCMGLCDAIKVGPFTACPPLLDGSAD